MARKIEVEIVGDAASVERAFARSSRAAKGFNQQITKQGKASALAFAGFTPTQLGAAGIGLALKASVDAASDLNEQVNKNRVIFGQSAAEVEAWSKTTAQAIGVSQREALTATGTFGNLFSTVGFGAKTSADMSRALVTLAADMASFNNASPADVLEAIRSGLVGEVEPLRRFGVRLSEVRVQQQAMADTGKQSARALTEQEKATARYEIILKDTKAQQGDFARTSQGLANQQRILRAQVDELAASVGKGLVPALTGLVGGLNDAIGAGERFNSWLGQFGADKSGLEYIHDLTSAVGDLIGVTNQAKLTPGMGALALAPLGPFARNVAPTGLGNAPGAFGATQPPAQFKFGGAFVPTAEQSNAWFDSNIGRMLGRVGGIAGLGGQIAELRRIGGLVNQRLALTKDITRRLRLEDQLFDINQRVASLNEQAAANEKVAAAERKAAAAARKAAAEEAARLAVAKQRARTQAGFDVLDFALERADATKRTRDNLAVLRDREAFIQTLIRREGRTLDLTRELWRTRQQIADLNKKKTEELGGNVTAFSHLQTERMLAALGLGLTPSQMKRLRYGLASVGAGGRVAAGGSGFRSAGGVVITGPVNIHGVQNVRQIEEQLEKRTASRSRNRRGAR